MELKWFKATTYTQGFGYVLNLIRKELIALQPVDSPDIAWDRTTEGIKARIVPKAVEAVKSRTPDTGEIASVGGGASSKYAGYFTVVDVPKIDGSPPTQIKIIDGANTESGIAGYADIAPSGIASALVAKAEGRVFLSATYSGGVYSFAFSISTAYPEGAYYELASISSDGVITQRYLDGGMIYFGERFFI